MLEEAWRLFKGGGFSRRPVRLIGLGLSGLVPPEDVQPDLFDKDKSDRKDRRVDEALDRINDRCGPGSLGFGLIRKAMTWG